MSPLVREFGWKLLALMLVISCALLPAVIWLALSGATFIPDLN